MDKLESVQHQLCRFLSRDPDYILDKCGDILSMNEFREIERQSSALEKMKVLLKIIMQKGGDTPQSFFDILRQHQSHYQDLQQLLNSNIEGSPTPTVFADGGSVVNAREIKNVKARNINMRVETVRNAGSRPAGNSVRQVPQADSVACDGSMICRDILTDIEADYIDLSACVTSSQVCAGTVGETLPSSQLLLIQETSYLPILFREAYFNIQGERGKHLLPVTGQRHTLTLRKTLRKQGPAVKTITEHKVELIDCLRADHSFILQHVHAKGIVTHRQYQNLMHISQPEEAVTKLIDKLIGNGQESCSLFLEVLKEPDILETYPQLNEITKTMC